MYGKISDKDIQIVITKNLLQYLKRHGQMKVQKKIFFVIKNSGFVIKNYQRRKKTKMFSIRFLNNMLLNHMNSNSGSTTGMIVKKDKNG